MPHINDELEYDGNENAAEHTFQDRQYAPSTRSPLQPGPASADHQYLRKHLGGSVPGTDSVGIPASYAIG
ncbi:hypothetical protein ACRYGW_20400 [Mycobacteroides abscessus]